MVVGWLRTPRAIGGAGVLPPHITRAVKLVLPREVVTDGNLEEPKSWWSTQWQDLQPEAREQVEETFKRLRARTCMGRRRNSKCF